MRIYVIYIGEKYMSADRNGVRWNRDEIILAFELYCRTPFGKIDQSNPEIIRLAELLRRTPASVGLKMHNLAHFDPELRKRNITAMAHVSKLDGEVFAEFSQNWTELSYQAQTIRAKMQKRDITDIIELGDIIELPEGEYKERKMKARIGQYFFRTAILNSYGNRCCVTGLMWSDMLVASHIKPWRVSDAQTERTNPSNGLCLNPFHDRAFDRGLITIDKNYCIIISDKICDIEMDQDTKNWFMGYERHQIILPDKFLPGKKLIEYHNDMIFQR